MEFDDEDSKYQFEKFADFIKYIQSSENLSSEFEYEKRVDEFKSLTFEKWKYYLPNYDEEKEIHAYLQFNITYDCSSLSKIKSKLENDESYEVFGEIHGYYPILEYDNRFCINLSNYREIFLNIINNHTHIGGVVIDFLSNYLDYNGYRLNRQIKEKIEKKYLTDFKFYVRDLNCRDYKLEEKYVPNTIIHDERQVLTSDMIGKMHSSYRFLIISSHIHQAASEMDFDVFRVWAGHFKVVDVFNYNDCCQIALLHLPQNLWMLFENDEFKVNLVTKARRCFIDSFKKKHHTELDDSTWIKNSFPIGLDKNNNPIEAFYTNTECGYPFPNPEMNIRTKMKITLELLDYYSPKPKEGKYPAPKWLLYPELPPGSMGWRMGYGESYDMKSYPYQGGMFSMLFPEPIMWTRQYQKDFEHYIGQKIYPIVAWSPKGKPKYNFNNVEESISNGDVIFVDNTLLHQEFRISSKKFKTFYDTKGIEKSIKRNVRKKVKYTIYLNMLYYIVMENDKLKDKLIESGNKVILFEDKDKYLGVKIKDGMIKGKNWLGFALMEVRDEVRRLYKNIDSVDWFLTEYLR